MAFSSMKCTCERVGTSAFTKEVFPQPGGPHKIKLRMWPCWNCLRMASYFLKNFFCPKNSSRDFGRSWAASGAPPGDS